MKYVIFALTIVTLVASTSLSLVANDVAPATIEGTIRDISCPIQNHKSTATDFNLECAVACAKQGSPLIILTKTGDVYIPISTSTPDVDQRQRLMPFVGKFVKVTGTVYELSGTRAIAMKTIEEDKNQKLKTDSQ
ncbi:MAG: hypothetical protein WB630_00830 [Candidatus Acidiferrales bacterium]